MARRVRPFRHPGQRLGIYLAGPGTSDYDATILDLIAPPATPNSQPGSTC